jgi:shikimate dehydrogenase
MPWVYCAPPRTGATVVASPVEPAQLPVDALRRYFSAEEPRGLFAVLGRPIAHSRSPRIHMTWMRAEHRTGLYVALESGDVSEFRRAISPLAEGGFRGLNITRPLKSAAFESATTGNDEDAVRTGCANTLRLRDGRVEAFNTDVAAVRRRFEELVDSRRWDGESLLVLGAGGAARAALVAAQDRGAHATVWARRPREARETARSFGAETDRKAPARSSTLVVNATPAGRVEAGALPFDVRGALEPGSYVLDFVYAPDDPSIRRAAEASGAGYEDGHRLLVYQAAASYGLWWGRPPSDELVTRAVEEEDACAA